MFCQNCGTEFNGKFCPNCGTPSAINMVPPGNGNILQDSPAPESTAANSAGIPSQRFDNSIPAGTPARSLNENPPAGTPANRPKKTKKKKGKGFLIPVAVIVVLLLFFASLSGGSSGSNGSGSHTAGSPDQNSARGNDQAGNQAGVTQTVETPAPPAGEDTAEANDNAGSSDAAINTEETKAPENRTDYSVRQEYFYDYVTSFGNHVGSAFVEIENTGTTAIYLHDGRFDFEDNNGHLLKSESMVSSCPDALLPGEIGYFYDDYIDLDDVDGSNGLNFVPSYKIEEARYEIVDYEVSDLGIREDSMFTCKVSGRLTNNQAEKISLLYVNVIYYDADNNVIGISGTNITDIQPGETGSFEISGQFFRDNVSYSDIAQYRVIPRAWYLQF